jgi:hypothetical protein
LKKLYAALLLLLFICLRLSGQNVNKKATIIHWADWQNDFTISLLLEIDSSMTPQRTAQIKEKLTQLFVKAEALKAQSLSQKKLLEKVFTLLFDAYLYKYQSLASFPQTIEKKEFGCVTGTLLFALTLEKLGFEYAIHETNLHVYLTVKTDEGEILIETTDKQFGFEKNSVLIAKRIESYQREYEIAKQNAKTYISLFKINRKISLVELVGLQYFNEAVNAYNQKNYEQAMNALKKSMQIYDAERGAELMYLIISKYLHTNQLSEAKKSKLIKYQDFYLHKLAAKAQ